MEVAEPDIGQRQARSQWIQGAHPGAEIERRAAPLPIRLHAVDRADLLHVLVRVRFAGELDEVQVALEPEVDVHAHVGREPVVEAQRGHVQRIERRGRHFHGEVTAGVGVCETQAGLARRVRRAVRLDEGALVEARRLPAANSRLEVGRHARVRRRLHLDRDGRRRRLRLGRRHDRAGHSPLAVGDLGPREHDAVVLSPNRHSAPVERLGIAVVEDAMVVAMEAQILASLARLEEVPGAMDGPFLLPRHPRHDERALAASDAREWDQMSVRLRDRSVAAQNARPSLSPPLVPRADDEAVAGA